MPPGRHIAAARHTKRAGTVWRYRLSAVSRCNARPGSPCSLFGSSQQQSGQGPPLLVQAQMRGSWLKH